MDDLAALHHDQHGVAVTHLEFIGHGVGNAERSEVPTGVVGPTFCAVSGPALPLGTHAFRASKTLATSERIKNESHRPHRPAALQPSLMMSGSLMERPART